MKVKSYKILFRFFSFLSDKTNGKPLFVKYKLLLGTIIIGLSTSCSSTPPKPDIPLEKVIEDSNNIDDTHKITCYDTIIPPVSVGNDKSDTLINNRVKCYMPAYIIEEDKNDSIS